MDITLTIEEADAIHALRGNTDWIVLDDAVKAPAIVNAIDFIQFRYGPFKESVESTNERLKIATALLALELHKNPSPLAAEQTVKRKKVKSDGTEVETEFQESDGTSPVDPYPLVTAMLAPLRIASTTGASLTFGRLVI